jgi:hypothetical protein
LKRDPLTPLTSAPPPDGRKNDIIVAAATAANADNADEAALEDVEDKTAMPPKKVPAAAAAAAAKKAASAATLKTGETDDLLLPAVKKIPKPFHLDVHDGGILAYYNEGGTDFVEVAMHVNGVRMQDASRQGRDVGDLAEVNPPGLLCEGAPSSHHEDRLQPLP